MALSLRKAINNIKKDSIFNNLAKNAGILFSGNVIIGILGFISLSITARALGVELLGLLALMQAYILTIDKLVNFQSWQALIKYGAEALEHNKLQSFRKLIKFGFILDISSSVLGTTIALLLTPLLGKFFGWESNLILMASLYSFIILFNINGTPIAILRLFNKFKTIAIQQVVMSAITLLGTIIAFSLGGELWFFVTSLTITTIIGYCLLIILSLKELHKNNIHNILTESIQNISSYFPGIWPFVWTTNFHGSIKAAMREVDIMIVGGVLGSSSAGLYKIAKQFGNALGQFAGPVSQVIYPEIAKAWARNDFHTFKTLVIRTGLIMGTVLSAGLIFFIAFTDLIFSLTVGTEFLEAKLITYWYISAIVLSGFTVVFSPAILAVGKPKLALYISLVNTLLYYLFLFVLLNMYGLIGAGIAYTLFYITWGIMLGMAIIKSIQNTSQNIFQEKYE